MQHPYPLTQITFSSCLQHIRATVAPQRTPHARSLEPIAAPGETALVVVLRESRNCTSLQPWHGSVISFAAPSTTCYRSTVQPRNTALIHVPPRVDDSWSSNMTILISAAVPTQAPQLRNRPVARVTRHVNKEGAVCSCEHTHAFTFSLLWMTGNINRSLPWKCSESRTLNATLDRQPCDCRSTKKRFDHLLHDGPLVSCVSGGRMSQNQVER